jgi:hypothetical protein
MGSCRVVWSAKNPLSNLTFILALASNDANAQNEWTWIYDTGYSNAQVADVVETASQGYLFLVQSSHNNQMMAQISQEGVLTASQMLNLGTNRMVAPVIYMNGSTNTYHYVAGVHDTMTVNGFGIAYYQADSDLEFELISHIPLNNDSMRIWTANGSWIAENTLVIPLVGTEPNWTNIPNRLGVIHLNTTGELLSFRKYGGGGSVWPRHAIPYSSDSTLISMSFGMSINPSGFSNFLYVNNELNINGAFPATNVLNNGPAEPHNVLMNGMHMNLLSNGSIICSGSYGSNNHGFRSAVVRYTSNGIQLAQFLPISEFLNDGCAIIQGHDSLNDQEMIHAYVENFHPYPPSLQLGIAPSRIRIHRLDTMLNPLCDFVIDGFEDNAYYYFNRIKATSDGGVVVMGSRRDLNTMDMPQAWVRKIAPNDCLTRVNELEAGQQQVSVFPNPGREGFQLHVQGPVVHGGQVLLHDMHGRQVLAEPLRMGQAQINTADLSPGMYLYRVVDAQGRQVASGKWVKD